MPKRTNDKNIFFETLDWICGKLEQSCIPYMITGGSAVGFWGHIRTTMDIDIVIQVKTENLGLFLEKIKDESYCDLDKTGKLLTGKKMFNVIYNKTCFKIDLIPLTYTPYEIEKFNNRAKIKLDDREIYVAAPEDLIISKIQWSKSEGGSERQIKDCESIYALNSKILDIDYITKWCKELGIEDIWNMILRQVK